MIGLSHMLLSQRQWVPWLELSDPLLTHLLIIRQLSYLILKRLDNIDVLSLQEVPIRRKDSLVLAQRLSLP